MAAPRSAITESLDQYNMSLTPQIKQLRQDHYTLNYNLLDQNSLNEPRGRDSIVQGLLKQRLMILEKTVA